MLPYEITMGPYFSSGSPTVALSAQQPPSLLDARDPSLSPPDFTSPAPMGHSSAPTQLDWAPTAIQAQGQPQWKPQEPLQAQVQSQTQTEAQAQAQARAQSQSRPIPSKGHSNSVSSTSSGPPRGRKRSRDDTDAEDDIAAAIGAHATPPLSATATEPVYGEGMTLMQPNGLIISAASQTGTWAEEAADAWRPATPPSSAAPRLLSRKSQRLDTSQSAPSSVPAGGAISATSAPSTSESPAVDPSALLLGVGWTSLQPSSSSSPTADPSTAAALRGWTRYIDNHFPLTSPELLLRSAGLAAYLVRAVEGFFLLQRRP